jgi:hypothetical protein
MGAKWNRRAQTQAKFVDKKGEWDAAADKEERPREEMESRPATEWEGKEGFFFLSVTIQK